jgi:hypothetical protein
MGPTFQFHLLLLFPDAICNYLLTYVATERQLFAFIPLIADWDNLCYAFNEPRNDFGNSDCFSDNVNKLQTTKFLQDPNTCDKLLANKYYLNT